MSATLKLAFSGSFRPLLAAVNAPERAVLLIDEIDRADEAFEAFLLANNHVMMRVCRNAGFTMHRDLEEGVD